MSKMVNIGYKISKIWAIIWYVLIPMSIYSAFVNQTFGFYDLIFYTFIMATIATIPIAILRYIKSQKQKELRNALH